MARNDAILKVVLGSSEKPPKERVLVVDDDESLLLTLNLFLEESGFEVEMARTVEDALIKLGGARFDALLLDLTVGNRSGEEILYFLGISLIPAPKKVIIMSANAAVIEDSHLKEMVTGILQKPFKFENLLQEIEEVS